MPIPSRKSGFLIQLGHFYLHNATVPLQIKSVWSLGWWVSFPFLVDVVFVAYQLMDIISTLRIGILCVGWYSMAHRMWREIRLLAASKPVVASMADVAASGGYYMAMAAGTIVAENLTLTGSIGVVTGKL